MFYETEVRRLSAVDYGVFSLVLIISAAIGIYFRFTGGKQKTTEEYLLAGKNMPIIPVAFSLMATFKSAIAFIGFPSEIYMYGTYIFWSQFWHIPGALLAGYLLFPSYFDLKCSTAYEFLRRRFGPVMRSIGSLAFMAQMIMYMSVVLYAPALSLSAVTSMSLWVSILSIGIVCTLYCTLGGMKAVLWTDAFQAVVMYMGLFALIIKGCIDLGGPTNVVRSANEGGRLQIPSLAFNLTDRYTFWNTANLGFFMSASTYGCSQIQIQRILTVKDVKQARRALFLSVAMSFVFMFCLACVGIIIYAYFQDCDPLTAPGRYIHKNDQLLPFYAMIALEEFPGLPGLCISSIFSAALSTMSSAVNSLTTVTIEDFIVPFCGNKRNSFSNSVLFAKILTFAYGAVCILGTLVVSQFGGVMQASMTIFGMFRGPLLGAFFLGMFTTTANETGVAIGTLASIAVVAWASFGAAAVGIKSPALVVSTEGCPTNITNPSSDVILGFLNATVASLNDNTSLPLPQDDVRDVFPLYKISFMWIIGIGFLLSVITGYCLSIIINTITGRKPLFETQCLNPMMRKFFFSSYKTNITRQNEKKDIKGSVKNGDGKVSCQVPSKKGVVNVTFDANLADEQSTKF